MATTKNPNNHQVTTLTNGIADSIPNAITMDDEQQLPYGYKIQDNFLFAINSRASKNNENQEWAPFSSPVWVIATTHDGQSKGWGVLAKWYDKNGCEHQHIFLRRHLSSKNGEVVISVLMDGGLPFIDLEKKGKSKLINYLMRCQPVTKIISIERPGWHNNNYVQPGNTIGPQSKSIRLHNMGVNSNHLNQQGSLEEWKSSVAELAINNSRLCFALSAAFAAPMLNLVDMEGGGFHFKGESADGKTTLMEAAASIYGNPKRYCQTWRATGNALEGIANSHNDALLCLDELGELDPREAGQIAYMLANGQGKGRSNQDGSLRERTLWRVLYLSTGELSLESHISSVGQRTHAGMEVRTVEIPSSTGKYGAFECLHGMSDGRAFADTLKANTARHHGVALPVFIEQVTQNYIDYKIMLTKEIKRISQGLTPDCAGNQVGRVIKRFALVAAAGELATQLGVTGWPKGEAIKATKACLQAFLAARGHLGNKEDAALLKQIRAFFAANQYSRFADYDDPNHRPSNCVGYRKTDQNGCHLYVTATGWQEITKGFSAKHAAKLCLDAGYLDVDVRNSQHRLQRQIRLPGMQQQTRVYDFNERVLTDDDVIS